MLIEILRKHIITMVRKIKQADVQRVLDSAYEKCRKEVNDGKPDAMMSDVNPASFAISIVLTDGRVFEKGDTKIKSPLGRIALVPSHVLVLSQNTPEELIQKAGVCTCSCKCQKKAKPDIPLSPHGVRAVSVITPQGDSDGKYSIMIDNIEDLAGSEPVLDDKLYERLGKEVAAADTINKIAEAGYNLYDDADIAVDLYTRLASLTFGTTQFATMGATIAADGRNPMTGEDIFDGKIAANVVTTMARGVHHEGRAWMMTTGLPAANSFGGTILAVLPGFGAIAAYSPLLDDNGVSIKAAKAIYEIAKELQLNVFASARVIVEK